MKIIIYHEYIEPKYIKQYMKQYIDGDKVHTYAVTSISALESLIRSFPDEDIHGHILPSAAKNPDLWEILQRIYNHKETIYLKHGFVVDTPSGPMQTHLAFGQIKISWGEQIIV